MKFLKEILKIYSTRTITRDLALGLASTTAVILAFVSSISYFTSVTRAENELNNEATQLVENIADVLTLPVWNVSYTTIEQIATAYLQSDDVAAIRIFDDNNAIIFDSFTEERDLIIETRPITYQDYQIGTIELAISKESLVLIRRNALLGTSALIFLVVSAVVIVTGFLLQRLLNQRLLRLTKGIEIIANGDYTHYLPAVEQEDINTIIQKVNSLANQIAERDAVLEERVAARTRDLRIAADVSRQISTELNTDNLLQQVVILSMQGFDLYAASIFMLEKDNLSLAFTASKQYQDLKSDEDLQRIPISTKPSIIALAARTREATIVNDVTQSPDFMPAPLLPKSRSELAIPIIHGNQLLGVFDLQSDKVDHFGQDNLRVLATLADQIAIAIRNAQLFAEVQAAQKTAEAANQAKSIFLSNMSHELRTPLNAILGYAQILKQPSLETNVDKGVHIIQQSGEHLLMLINDILDLSKIEAGKMELVSSQIDFHSFLESVANIVRTRANKKLLTFNLDISKNLPSKVIVDETRLRQILLNLLGNAVKFTEAGHVTFRVTQCQDTVSEQHEHAAQNNVSQNSDITESGFCCLCFEVEDSGIGIPAEDKERIFQPFEQAGNIGQRSEGTGLGLAISHQLVELLGGSLQLQSEPDKGNLFWFEASLPIVASKEITQTSSFSERQIIGYKGASRKVLVADDVYFNRIMVVDLLRPLGFELIEARDGQQAVTLAQEYLPDIILMDQVMPVMDGQTAVKKIRQNPILQDVPVIAVSAGVSQKDQQQSLEDGYDSFLPKPINWLDLAALFEKHLQLEWIYEKTETADALVDIVEHPVELVPPPQEEISILFDLVSKGKIYQIQERTIYIEEMGEQYVPFAKRLQHLASNFEIAAIQNLIKKHLSN